MLVSSHRRSGTTKTQMPSPIFTVELPSSGISVNDCRAELYLNALRASTEAKYLSAVIAVPSDLTREAPDAPCVLSLVVSITPTKFQPAPVGIASTLGACPLPGSIGPARLDRLAVE